jgi:hypothetical protein
MPTRLLFAQVQLLMRGSNKEDAGNSKDRSRQEHTQSHNCNHPQPVWNTVPGIRARAINLHLPPSWIRNKLCAANGRVLQMYDAGVSTVKHFIIIAGLTSRCRRRGRATEFPFAVCNRTVAASLLLRVLQMFAVSWSVV